MLGSDRFTLERCEPIEPVVVAKEAPVLAMFSELSSKTDQHHFARIVHAAYVAALHKAEPGVEAGRVGNAAEHVFIQLRYESAVRERAVFLLELDQVVKPAAIDRAPA